VVTNMEFKSFPWSVAAENNTIKTGVKSRPIAFYFCWGTAHNNILLTEVPWASCISTSLMSLGIGIGRL